MRWLLFGLHHFCSQINNWFAPDFVDLVSVILTVTLLTWMMLTHVVCKAVVWILFLQS